MSGKVTNDHLKQGEKRKAENEHRDREEKRLPFGKGTGPNDLIVNPNLDVVKTEEDCDVVVKEEVNLDTRKEDEGPCPSGSGGNEVVIKEEPVDIQTGGQVILNDSGVELLGGEVNPVAERDPLEENEDLRRENQLLKQKMEEVELRIKQLQELMKPQDVCPPVPEVNSPRVVPDRVLVPPTPKEPEVIDLVLSDDEDISVVVEDTPEGNESQNTDQHEGTSSEQAEAEDVRNPTGESLTWQFLTLGLQKCSEEIADLRQENRLLKQQQDDNRLEIEKLHKMLRDRFPVEVQEKEGNSQEVNIQDESGQVENSSENGQEGNTPEATIQDDNGQEENIPENFQENATINSGQTLPNPCARGYLRLDNSLMKSRHVYRNWRLQVESNMKQKDNNPEKNPNIISGKVLPIMCSRGYLKLDNSLLNSRLVCKNWRHQVDNFLENPYMHREFDKMESQLQIRRRAFKVLPDVSNKAMCKLENNYTFSYTRTIERFLKKFENFEGNPFLGRTAHFSAYVGHVFQEQMEQEAKECVGGSVDDLAEMHRYWKLVGKLLEKFGHHLWYVNMYQLCFELSPLELYKILEKCFLHLKNVKCLTIHGKYEVTCTRKEKPSKLAKYMAKNSLPELPNLRELNFEFPTGAILNAILKISPVLTTLTVQESKVPLKDIANSVGKLPLKQLTYVTRPKAYQSLSCVSKDLEKLVLHFNSSAVKITKVGLGELLLVLREFPRLCELKLKGIISLDEEPALDGENLENLSVETLELENCYDDKKEERGFLEDMYQTDGFYARILSRFPNLRFLDIQDKRQANSTTPLKLRDYSDDFVFDEEPFTKYEYFEAFCLATTYRLVPDSNEKTPGRNKCRTRTMFWKRTRKISSSNS